jgi:GT2 family glycosyltransferase
MQTEKPSFSVIVPTCSRPKQLAACLQSIARLDYPRDRFEVIVVDDGSQTPLEHVIAPFRRQLNLVLIRQEKSGPGAARNSGAARATGKFLAFTDDDCAPATTWLLNLGKAFVTQPNRIIGGRVLDAIPKNPYSAASQLMHDAVYAYYNADPGKAQFLSSNNLAVPTDRFIAIGGFDTTLPLAAGEDNELCSRWLLSGYPMTYSPEIVVYHAHELTFRSFWKQHFNRGRAACHYGKLQQDRGWDRVRVDRKFYLHLLGYPFLQVDRIEALRLEVLFFVSQLAKIAGFICEKTKRR